ncbi:hypothetical protein TrVE_jg4577 [Triparma verrucosa]|uniref:Uncharacterized protein n=1 Tax=Triparma verrucosa TaxID=1606542 RepID=A0A9W7CGT5_9STRA|nr:hypothetical protein TrVE_jg4577 [Triparma verrucosa]
MPKSSDFSRWRTNTLGTGADYATPKLNHVRRLTSIVVESGGGRVRSCAVLSNCQRFDVLITSPDDDVDFVNELVAGCLAREAERYAAANREAGLRGSLLNGLRLFLDMPSSSSSWEEPDRGGEYEQILEHITTLTEPTEIATYLALAAAGMNNPKRPYNPYNSRDSHIMLQLKRCLQTASIAPATTSSSPPRNATVLDLLSVSLKCGSIARNENACPSIKSLKPYGKKYSPSTPSDLLETVKSQVKREKIDPIIEEFVNEGSDFNAIIEFRTSSNEIGEALGINAQEVAKLIHEPTLILKGSESTDKFREYIESRVDDLENELVLGEAILIRNESQLGSFVDEEEQWNAMDPQDIEVLEGREAAQREVKFWEEYMLMRYK